MDPTCSTTERSRGVSSFMEKEVYATVSQMPLGTQLHELYLESNGGQEFRIIAKQCHGFAFVISKNQFSGMDAPFRNGVPMEYPMVFVRVQINPFHVGEEDGIGNFPHADHFSGMEFVVGKILGNEGECVDLGPAKLSDDAGSSELISDVAGETPNVPSG